MILAAVHLQPFWTIPPVLAAGAMLIWYWFRLGQLQAPPSRRRIRRWSVVIMFFSLPVLVRGLSFADRDAEPQQYIITWTIALLMMLLIIAAACLDAINTLRLHQRQLSDEALRSAQELRQAIAHHRALRDWPRQDTPNGKEKHA